MRAFLIFCFLSLSSVHAESELTKLAPYDWQQEEIDESLFSILLEGQQPVAVAYDTVRHMLLNNDSFQSQQESFAKIHSEIEATFKDKSSPAYHYLLAKLYNEINSHYFQPEKIETELILAAEQNQPEASYELGQFYRYNDFYQDFTSALMFYEVAAMHAFKRAWQQPYPKWQRYYRDLAASAEYQLAKLYEEGKGTNQDLHKAWNHYHRAARMRHNHSTYRVALMYKNGFDKVVEPDLFESLFWFQRLVNKDDPELTDPDVLIQIRNIEKLLEQ